NPSSRTSSGKGADAADADAGVVAMTTRFPSGWEPGNRIASPTTEFQEFDPEVLGTGKTYRYMIASILPRPIAFVSTMGENGTSNLAPFSFFNGVSSNPPCLIFSVTRKPDGSKKDTLLNIEQTGEFVVN